MAKKFVQVVKRETGETLAPEILWCSGWWCRLRGLQFRRPIQPGAGLVLVHKKDSVANSSIHMFFVFFPIAAIWINREGRVTRAQLAQPWRPYYASPEPASYVLETTPDMLTRLHEGEYVDFQPVE